MYIYSQEKPHERNLQKRHSTKKIAHTHNLSSMMRRPRVLPVASLAILSAHDAALTFTLAHAKNGSVDAHKLDACTVARSHATVLVRYPNT